MPICNPEAIYCTEAQMPRSDQCLTPCEGVYADITHENLDIIDINTPGLKNVMEAYENYKNQFLKELPFPFSISGNTCGHWKTYMINLQTTNLKPSFTMSESHSIHQHLTSYKRF